MSKNISYNIDQLRSLVGSDAWQTLLEILREDIENLKEELVNLDIDDIIKLKEKQLEIKAKEKLLDYPAVYIRTNMTRTEDDNKKK